MDGKTALGASSPANPALHMPEPLSTTRAATSSSAIVQLSGLSAHAEAERLLSAMRARKLRCTSHSRVISRRAAALRCMQNEWKSLDDEPA